MRPNKNRQNLWLWAALLLPLLWLAAGLAQIGASEPTKRVITGAVIVVAVVLDTYRSHRQKK